jgi:hypothetical protein
MPMLRVAMTEDKDDGDDPWTFFGGFSKVEIAGATRLLAEAGIAFEVKESALESESGWSGPFALWVRDESAARASAVLTAFFKARGESEA